MKLSDKFYKEQKFRDRELKLRRKERRDAEKKILQLELQNERAMKRARTGIRTSRERVERLSRHPSHRNAEALRKIAIDRDMHAETRARAAEIVLRWGVIGPVASKSKRRRPAKKPKP